jgi:aladin
MTNHPSLLNVPDPGVETTQCEVSGLLSPALPPGLARLFVCYPDCSANLSSDHIRSAATKGSLAAAAFLPRKAEVDSRGGLTKVLASWWEEGVEGLLSLSSSSISRRLLALWRFSWSLSSSLYPHLRLSSPEMISEFTSSHSWPEAPTRCLAWHPHTAKLAIAFSDDTVRVASTDTAATQPLLKYAGMKGVNCLAWHPCGSSQLAVGCQAGVLVWTVDAASVVSRPSSSCVTKLVGHRGPVTGLSWAPDGRLLASCSPADTRLLIWSPARQAVEQLQRVGGGGVSLVSWAPNWLRLFSATPGRTFRVWDTADWDCQRWTVGGKNGRVASAAWAPDGLQLLFATTDEPVLYSVSFQSGAEAAIPVMDLAAVSLANGDTAGGLVQDIQWDPTGQRVAISFRDTDFLLLLRARPGSLPGRLSPVGWVTGRSGERPTALQFQASPVSVGALLSVAWSSGRLQHVPFVFGAPGSDVSYCQTESWLPGLGSQLFSVPGDEE